MPRFAYTALNAQHKTISGALEAADRTAALSLLSKQNLKPISVKLDNAKKIGNINLFKAKVKSKDLVIFTRQLSTMVSAGVPLLRALSTLQQQTESKRLAEVLGVVNKDVQGGMSLGDAFEKHPDVFTEIYTNMVRAGEAGGILEDILKRLALQQEKNDSIRKKVKGAMTYPVVLLVITVGAFFGMMIFVVPMIGGIARDLSGGTAELPAITKIMLDISGFMQNQWYIMIGGFVAAVFLIRRYLKTEKGRSRFHHLIIRAPVIGNVVTKLAVARFARTFASLLGAGVSVLEALRVTGKAIGNLAYQEALEEAATAVKNGKQLSETLTGSKLFPQIVPQMLAVGEETGQTDVILVKVADFYEEEVDTLIGSLSSILEPVMIVIMGGMVGLIAASVMSPIANLSNNVN